ncbi:tautomerase family protein [Methylobacterium sp. A49B]
MPFINVKVAGRTLAKSQVERPQAGITSQMSQILHKVGPLAGVLVEEVPLAGWSVGRHPVACAAQVDAIISAETNTAEEKARFIAETSQLLKDVLGTALAEVSYVVIHEVPKDSWGYDGRTQADRAQRRSSTVS